MLLLFTPPTCTCSKLTRCCMNVKVWWTKQHQCTNTSIKLRYWSHVGVDFSSLNAGITLKWKTIQEELYFVSTGPFLRQYKKYNIQKTLGSRSSYQEYTKFLLSPFVTVILYSMSYLWLVVRSNKIHICIYMLVKQFAFWNCPFHFLCCLNYNHIFTIHSNISKFMWPILNFSATFFC